MAIHDPQKRGFLPRLCPEHYRGTAIVLWTHTIENRATGWLTSEFHARFREGMLHAAAREHLLNPIYTLMPDHLHLIWMGVAPDSDQRIGTTFLRSHLEKFLTPHHFQHQGHDSVLRESRRSPKALANVCEYVAENPVRAGLCSSPAEWRYAGCIVPGYPSLERFAPTFWQIYNAAVDRGRIGKISSA